MKLYALTFCALLLTHCSNMAENKMDKNVNVDSLTEQTVSAANLDSTTIEKQEIKQNIAEESQNISSDNKKEPQTVKTDKKDKSDTLKMISVSFYSIGSGINTKAKKEFDDFLAAFSSKEKVTLPSQINSWGREGEIDYCFDLAGVKKKIKDRFLSKTTQLLTDKKWVRITTNKPCKKAPSKK